MKQKNLIVIIAIILLLLFVMFFIRNFQNKTDIVSNSTVVSDASTSETTTATPKTLGKNINANDLQAALNSDNPPTVISLNTKEVYDNGHIINSVNIPYTDDVSAAFSALDKNTHYVLYGDSPSQTMTTAETMKELGFNVLAFTDGLMVSDGPNSWMSMGNPIISSVISAETPVKTESKAIESDVIATEETTAETMTVSEVITELVVPAEYTIQAGDTIYKIGRKFGISSQDIIAINQLTNPNVLLPGQVIRLK